MSDAPRGAPTVLQRGVQIVGVLFAAFGGYLTNIAPPAEAGSAFAVGAASFVALGVLLYIAALSRGRDSFKRRRRWLVGATIAFAATIAAGVFYRSAFERLTYAHADPGVDERRMRGTVYTSAAELYRSEHPGSADVDLVLELGGLETPTNVWTEASLAGAALRLTALYVALVLALSATIFSLTEGALAQASLRKA